MDSFEINKIVAAVLVVALLVIGIGKISDIVFHVEKPEKPGYVVEVEVKTTSVSTETQVEEKVTIVILQENIRYIIAIKIQYFHSFHFTGTGIIYIGLATF